VRSRQRGLWTIISDSLRGNGRSACGSRLLPLNCSSTDSTCISTQGDEAAIFSAARHSAQLGTNAFISPRSFGCGCAALRKFNQEQLSGLHPDRIELQLSYYDQHVVIYHQHAYAQIPLLSFSRELLEMGPEARAKALGRIRKLEKSLLSPPQNLPPP